MLVVQANRVLVVQDHGASGANLVVQVVHNFGTSSSQSPGTVRACNSKTCENGDCINNDTECKCHTGYKGAKCDELFVQGYV